MFHIHITIGMLTTSQDHVHIPLHVLSSCDPVLSIPPVPRAAPYTAWGSLRFPPAAFECLGVRGDMMKYLISHVIPTPHPFLRRPLYSETGGKDKLKDELLLKAR